LQLSTKKIPGLLQVLQRSSWKKRERNLRFLGFCAGVSGAGGTGGAGKRFKKPQFSRVQRERERLLPGWPAAG